MQVYIVGTLRYKAQGRLTKQWPRVAFDTVEHAFELLLVYSDCFFILCVAFLHFYGHVQEQ